MYIGLNRACSIKVGIDWSCARAGGGGGTFKDSEGASGGGGGGGGTSDIEPRDVGGGGGTRDICPSGGGGGGIEPTKIGPGNGGGGGGGIFGFFDSIESNKGGGGGGINLVLSKYPVDPLVEAWTTSVFIGFIH